MYDYKNLKFCPRCSFNLSIDSIHGRRRKHCKECGYILYRNPYPGTSALIEKDGKILLVKRDEEPHVGWWSLPGGFIEFDESPERAVRREVYEETGYKVKINNIIGVYFYTKNVEVNAMGPTYSAEIVGGKPLKNVIVKWFNANKLPKKFAYPDQLKAINDWRRKYGR